PFVTRHSKLVTGLAMSSLFNKIVSGEMPGHVLFEDDRVFAILTIAPLKPGHALVIPRQEIDHWIDVPDELMAHLMAVARRIGAAIQQAYAPVKVGLMIAGLEVRHIHIHLVPIEGLKDLDFERQNRNVTPEELAASAEKIRTALQQIDRI